MVLLESYFAGYLAFPQVAESAEEMARLGTKAVFQTRPTTMNPYVLAQLERKDRAVLLLLDGKRTVREVARLAHRSELDIALLLVRLLKRGYIDFVGLPG